MPVALGVLASGSGSNLQSIIDSCEAGNIDAVVKVVLSNKEDAFALERARKHNIPAVHINPRNFSSREDFEEEVCRVLQGHGVELVCLAGYMLVVTKTFIGHYPDRILNIHPALLPSFPGTHGQRDAFDYGVRFSGCTVHFVDEGMDTGPIILQAIVPVMPGDDSGSLGKRILSMEHKVYPRVIQLYAEGRLTIEGRKVKISGDEDWRKYVWQGEL